MPFRKCDLDATVDLRLTRKELGNSQMLLRDLRVVRVSLRVVERNAAGAGQGANI